MFGPVLLFSTLCHSSFEIILLRKRERAGCFTLTHINLASFCGTKANSSDPDQTPHNAASDQGLHWENLNKIENYHPTTLKMEMDWSN